MSARRQPSTTSLSKYARANTPEFSNRSLDFCNAFWGLGDGGVDVLFARMRGAMRTMEELRGFWKERASIEEQYAKRLATLAKSTLGRDEIGDLRVSLDTLKQETEKQSGYHLMVAQQIKTDLEGQTTAFWSKQQQHKKSFQTAIEKEFKTKQTQESYVNKAREKYEADCVRINSYTAQSTLMQGKDLEKIQLKLERAQQTVQANERDFANFARALQDTVQKWEMDWKTFCDSCQDMEEERMEFMKDNMWAYANAVSTVCVADDESCEKLRLALEQVEPERDMENFVRDYGTGSVIPDPPAFINYANPDAVPSSSQPPRTRPADFVRSSQRTRPAAPSPAPQDEDLEPVTNIAGVGMGGGRRADATPDPQLLNRAQSRSRASHRGAPETAQPNGAAARSHQPSMGTRPADPTADPIDPTAKTMIKIGENAYEVDLSRDPQARQGPGHSSHHRANGSASPVKVGQEDDPLARQMEELKKQAPGRGASVRRSAQWPSPQQAPIQNSHSPSSSISPTKRDSAANLSPPPGTSADRGRRSSRDYGPSANMVVGAAPPMATSRPTSPSAPYPKHMVPPSQSSAGPSANLPVQDILADYQQSFPGERKSISRPPSQAGSVSGIPGHAPSLSQSHIQRERPLSISGHAGIGAQGRSTSPQPFASVSRSTSPAVPQAAPPSSHRNSYVRVPAPARPTSPNSVGIALDPTGRVAMDSMAETYAHRQPQPPYGQPVQAPPPPAVVPQPTRQPTYTGQNGYSQQTMPSANAAQPPYGAPISAVSAPGYGQGYGVPPSHQSPPSQPVYGYQPPSQQPPHPQQVYQPQPHGYAGHGAGSVVRDLQRDASVNGSMNQYYGLTQPQQHQPTYRAPSPARAPSPQPPLNQPPLNQPPLNQPPPNPNQPPPTGQYTEDGRGVLFYVKALYDYQATIDEEFDFQSGDIIAVTATPEDGWWSGELLDEARRQPGRHVFPSNFVCLF
ncbi:hypothetical protein IEO21_06125 [Rhodonia placenta]|uniref:Septation protein imp2 n=1 Tax=Rhodonia placenta TaxID=104341 RepID=A0A8H7P0M2_9APHY|nr:hypothetical protein IEO21_06125 [Postia placenta]